jgi:outer membrane lipoprotein-sorting protein
MAIVGLLAQGGFLKYFSVVGVMAAPGDDQLKTIYFLQPQRELVEFTRAQARLTIDGKNIFELRYWDEIGNETSLLFSNTRLNPPLAESMFEYVPPKDADVTTI